MLTIRSNSYEGRYLELTVREAGFDSGANTSTVAWELKSAGGIASRYYIADTAVILGTQQVYFYDAPYWTDSAASGSYPFPITQGAVSGTVTVPHDPDGSKTLSVTLSTRVYVSMTPEGYTGSLTLTDLAGGSDPGGGAARITAAGNGVLGKTAPISWTPQSASQLFTVSYVLSQSGGTTAEKVILCRPTSADTYTLQLPLDYALAEAIPDGVSRELAVTLRTYRAEPIRQENQVGSASVATITVTLAQDENTRPRITGAAAAPSPDLLGGAYIQGKTGIVLTDVTAQGRYGATIRETYLRLEGANYPGATLPMAQWGSVQASVYALDSRGFLSEPYPITVEALPYMPPKLRPATGAARITARRCDADGTLNDQGACLTLALRRSCSDLYWQGSRRNFCALSFRWRQSGPWSGWQELLAAEDPRDEITSGPLLGGLAPEEGVQLQLRAQDTLGGETVTELSLSSRRIYWHRHGALGSLGFGEEVQEPDVFLIGREKTLKLLGALAPEGEAARYLLDLAHPVGSVLETVSAEDPAETIGGQWTQMTGSEDTVRWRRVG